MATRAAIAPLLHCSDDLTTGVESEATCTDDVIASVVWPLGKQSLPAATSRLNWFGWYLRGLQPSLSRRRRGQQGTEALESRLLLVSPIDELNSVLANGRTNANNQINAIFNDAGPQVTGELNGSLGQASTQANGINLGGRQLEDADTNAISSVFGSVETAIQGRIAAVLGQKPSVSAEGTFSIGTQYNMPYGSMFPLQLVYGSTGTYGINLLTGDFWVASNTTIPLVLLPGMQSRTLTLNGNMNRLAGNPDTFSVQGNYSELFTNGDAQSWTLKFQQTPNSGVAKQSLEAHATKRVGSVSTYADVILDDGAVVMTNFGGNGSFSDGMVSFSGNHTPFRDKVTASADYLAGPVQATARFTYVHDTTPNMTPFDGTVAEGLLTWHGTDNTLFQAGAFNSVVNGNSHTGGLLKLVSRQKKNYFGEPGFVDVSVTTENGIPTSAPSIIDLYQLEDRSFFDWGFFHRSAFDSVHGHWNDITGVGGVARW